MKVLITGGAGFIGSHLCSKFVNTGNEVICIDHLGTGSLNNIEDLGKTGRFKFMQKDVTKDLDDIEKVDLILHFASRASPSDYQTNSFDTLLANSIGTFNLLKKAQKDSARFLFASTSEVYGKAEVIPTPETYYGYVNSFGPRSCYDESKRFGEALCYEFIHKFNIDCRIVRIFNTYGPHMRYNDGRVMTNFIMQALDNEPITIYGDGKQTRSFCFVDDLIEGIYTLATKKELNGEVINIGNPEEVTILELAKKIVKVTNSKSKIIFKDLPMDDPPQRVPDITKAKKLLNWSPKIKLETGLAKMIEWMKE
ncbi:Bifunctional polymyxin resistance protein ArnA [Candidatus Tiddalikarchaeum anstoanum]|nr:Bifunctional polymyxin resistance protein ArnA [Candidatus Tiddalikarchaeum anstoanum]